MREEWNNFKQGIWVKEINVRDFIQQNYTPYEGDDSFLCDATETTKELWAQVMELTKEELAKGGVLDMDTHIISTITSHGPGYLNKDTIKVGVPSGKCYAAYSTGDTNDDWTLVRQEITQSMTNLTMGGAFTLRNATTGTSIDGVDDMFTLIEKTQDITELFRGVKKYAMGGQFAVEILLTQKGREVFKEASSTVAATEDKDILFYVGEEQLLKLTCDGMIDSDSFFISVEDAIKRRRQKGRARLTH